MDIIDIEGDLFDQPAGVALAHGVNCAGAMGAGIAAEFRRRWPAMYAAYRARCDARTLRPGDVFAWATPDRMIYNLATQLRTGRCASLAALERAAVATLDVAARDGVARVALPRIGAGIGGLAWPDARAALARACAASPARVQLVVVSRPDAEDAA